MGYVEPRLWMTKYAEWREQDLVVASGQVEGAVRHMVGERMDYAWMRWIPGRSEAVLHLRCIELNGDWEDFIAWSDHEYRKQLIEYEAVRIRSHDPWGGSLTATVSRRGSSRNPADASVSSSRSSRVEGSRARVWQYADAEKSRPVSRGRWAAAVLGWRIRMTNRWIVVTGSRTRSRHV